MAQIRDFVFRHGMPLHIDYTPTSGDVNSGTAVLLGNLTGLTMGIASVDLANNVKGALATGGVWHATIEGAYAAGTTVYKPAANAVLTSTSTNNSKFGYLVEASTANTVHEVVFDPRLDA